MDERIKSINEIVSDQKDDQIKQDDISWSCLEGELYGEHKVAEYGTIQNTSNEAMVNTNYEEPEYYDPFTVSTD